MKKIILLLITIICIFSCQSEKEKKLLIESQLIFDTSITNVNKSLYNINVDSFRVVFQKKREENPQLASDFANRFEKYSVKLLQKREEIELAKNILQAERRQKEIEKKAEDRKVWEYSKYGKLQKKHPEWTDEECMKVIDKKLWIGMSLEMLKYQRGIPDRANPSNYGGGTKWQWCWDDYTPSCFYGKDGIISAYN
jgi:beta-galactosidase/beta-glucuronidase